MDNTEELKLPTLLPCPFCGGEATEAANLIALEMVECRHCFLYMAKKYWNTRTP
jgi:hypothetical protein